MARMDNVRGLFKRGIVGVVLAIAAAACPGCLSEEQQEINRYAADMRSGDEKVAQDASARLLGLAEQSDAAFDELARAATDKDSMVRSRGLNALCLMDRAKDQPRVIDVLVSVLKHPDTQQRLNGTMDLVRLRVDSRDRCSAAEAAMKRAGVEWDWALVRVLRGPEPDSRQFCAGILLSELDHLSPAVVDELVDALGDSRVYVHKSAMWAICVRGLNFLKVEPLRAPLLKGLKTANPLRRKNSTTALWSLFPDDKSLVPVLIEVLKDPDWVVRAAGAWGLMHMKVAQEAVPALKAMCQQDPHVQVRWAAAQAVAVIVHGPEDLAFLRREVAASDPYERSSAILALRECGCSDKETLAVLQAAAKDKDEFVRSAAESLLKDRFGVVQPASTSRPQ